MNYARLLATLLLAGVASGFAHAQAIDPPKAAPPTFSGVALTPNYGFAFSLTSLTTQSEEQTVTLKNTYLGAAWTIASVTSTDPQYVVTNQTCTQAPIAKNGGTCSVTLKFVPTLLGLQTTGKISINRTSAGGAFWIPVTSLADAAPRVPSLPAAPTFSGIVEAPAQGLAFSELLPGRVSAVQTLTVKNSYLGANSTISAVTSSDPTHFEVVSETCTVAVLTKNGGTCTVSVRFKPTAAGVLSGKINFTRPTAGGNFYASVVGWGKQINTLGYQFASTSLVFPDTVRTQVSVEQTATLQNTGDTPWTVTGVTTSNVSFAVIAHTCSTLAPGASCAIRLVMKPAEALSYSGSVRVARQGLDTLTLPLSGKGVFYDNKLVQVTPEVVAFPVTQIGFYNEQLVTLKNVSATQTWSMGAGEFRTTSTGGGLYLAENTCTQVLPGKSCTLKLRFAPQSLTGGGTATAPLKQAVQLQASGASPVYLRYWVDAPRGNDPVSQHLEASPGLVSFPDTTVGATQEMSLMLTNISATTAPAPAYVGVPQLTSGAAGFSLKTHTCPLTLAPGESCRITLSFSPLWPGALSDTLSFSVGNSATVAITGKAVDTPPSLKAEILSAPYSTSLMDIRLGESRIIRLNLTNVGGGTLQVKGVTATGATLGSGLPLACASIVYAYSYCTVLLTYTPTAVGSFTSSIVIQHSASATPTTLTASGSVYSDMLSGAPATLDFTNGGSTVVVAHAVPGYGVSKSFLLTNPNPQAVSLANLSLSLADSTHFSVKQGADCGPSLAAGASCTIGVAYDPKAAGTHATKLTVGNLAGAQTVVLKGQAKAAYEFKASPSSLTYSPAIVGQAQSQLVRLTNVGSVAEQLTALADSSELTVSGCATAVAAGAYCELAVSLTPSSSGLRSGNVVVKATSTGAVVANLAWQANADAMAPLKFVDGASLTLPEYANRYLVAKLTNTSAYSVTFKRFYLSNGSTLTSGGVTVTPCSEAGLGSGQSCDVRLSIVGAPSGIVGIPLVVELSNGATVPLPLSVIRRVLDPYVGQLTADQFGANPVISISPSTVQFPVTTVGQKPAWLPVTITNIGGKPANIGGLAQEPGGPFHLLGGVSQQYCPLLEPGQSCLHWVYFEPTATGDYSINPLFFKTDAYVATPLTLKGSAQVFPEWLNSWTPWNIDGGATIQQGVAETRTVSFANSSAADLPGFEFSSSSPYMTVTHNCDKSLARGATCSATFQFLAGAGHAPVERGVLTISPKGTGISYLLQFWEAYIWR